MLISFRLLQVDLVSKRKKKCLLKNQLFLLMYSQTPPSLRATPSVASSPPIAPIPQLPLT